MFSKIRYPILFCVLFLSIICYAQPGGGGDPGGGEPVPITGIEILIGAGAILGLRQFLQRKPKQ